MAKHVLRRPSTFACILQLNVKRHHARGDSIARLVGVALGARCVNKEAGGCERPIRGQVERYGAGGNDQDMPWVKYRGPGDSGGLGGGSGKESMVVGTDAGGGQMEELS
jgi:hypothetical protein